LLYQLTHKLTVMKNKTLATEVKTGDTIKSPHSNYWGLVTNITDEGGKKIYFDITYTSPEEIAGNKFNYAFFKTTKVTIK
jgi:hypothetical protein